MPNPAEHATPPTFGKLPEIPSAFGAARSPAAALPQVPSHSMPLSHGAASSYVPVNSGHLPTIPSAPTGPNLQSPPSMSAAPSMSAVPTSSFAESQGRVPLAFRNMQSGPSVLGESVE